MNSSEHRIYFAGHEIVLDASGVLYWPAERLLVASDLHFEKGSYYAQHGSVLPPYDTLDTLERLEQRIAYYQPQRLVLLGDSFHDRLAWERLGATLRARIEALATQVAQIHWIEGNHDVGLHGKHRFEEELVVGSVLFTHDHRPATAFQVIGHYHPKTSIALGNRHLRARCFAAAPNLLIMPAFGSYTGGLDIAHDAIRTLARDAPFTSYLLYNGKIYMR